MISFDADGFPTTGSIAGDYSLLFARAWSERLRRQMTASNEAVARYKRIDREADRIDEWSPSEQDVDRAFRSAWAEAVSLVWTAHQAEQWTHRLARELGEVPRPPIPMLRTLRDALEHLDDAEFGHGEARAGSGQGNRSLRKLPGSRVRIDPGWGGLPILDLIDERAMRRLADEVSDRLTEELDSIAEAHFTQEVIDELRGK